MLDKGREDEVYTAEAEILNLPGNLTIPPQVWLQELFEYTYCEECGGDAEHHTAVPFDGNWFARCDYPLQTDGAWHPVIKEFRKEEFNKGGGR